MINGFLTLVTWIALFIAAVYGFMKFKSFMDDDAIECARESGYHAAKRHRYPTDKLILIGVVLLAWLGITFMSFNSPIGDTAIVFFYVVTGILLGIIYYNSYRARKLQAVAWTFLSVPFAVAVWLAIYRSNQQTMGFLGAVLFGFAIFFVITLTTYLLYKLGCRNTECEEAEVDDETDDEDEDPDEDEEPDDEDTPATASTYRYRRVR